MKSGSNYMTMKKNNPMKMSDNMNKLILDACCGSRMFCLINIILLPCSSTGARKQ